MEGQNQKWVNLSYLAAAVLVGYLVSAFAAQVVGIYDLEARIRNVDLIVRGLAVVLGAILFIGLYRHQKVNQFMNEVIVELSRVTWPTQKETTNATIIVIVMVIVSGMILGFLDYLWTELLRWVL